MPAGAFFSQNVRILFGCACRFVFLKIDTHFLIRSPSSVTRWPPASLFPQNWHFFILKTLLPWPGGLRRLLFLKFYTFFNNKGPSSVTRWPPAAFLFLNQMHLFKLRTLLLWAGGLRRRFCSSKMTLVKIKRSSSVTRWPPVLLFLKNYPQLVKNMFWKELVQKLSQHLWFRARHP